MKRQFLNAVPILCVQRFSSVQRNIGFLMIYDLAKAEFPTSSVGAHWYVSRQMEFSCLPLPAPCHTWSLGKVSKQDMDT